MKKLLSLLTALLCAVMLASPAFAADDAYGVYQKCIKKIKSLSSMEISQTLKVSMSDKGHDFSSKYNTAIKILSVPDNKLHAEIKTTGPDSDEPAYYYYKNGYYYGDTGFYKARSKMKADDLLSKAANLDLNLTKNDFKDATVEKVSGGVKITFKTKLADSKDESVRRLAETPKTLDDGSKISFSDISTVLTVGNDGMLKSCSVSLSMTMSRDGSSYKIKQTQTSTVKSVNTVTKIDFPSDLNTYVTIS